MAQKELETQNPSGSTKESLNLKFIKWLKKN